ncbi:transglycosylase SLT domain-containing protein [Arenibaculum pallidiluteum]|uniref:transglycosylase SLT domain-containing protein n=1 Tax=Arenibaculum pallidiluteum TaxID=2812559 RepID=UPI001A9780F8|nr:transglycosylase SLT domain-containing protein [Arenibaculum pallidiluteum]
MNSTARLGRTLRGGLLGMVAIAATALTAAPAPASQPTKRQAPAPAEAAAPPAPAATANTAPSCTEHALEAERQFELPSGLLLAVSLVETGMSGKPRPFAINHDGRSVSPESIDEARRHLRDGSGRLKSSLFVGCMQLSVTYHAHAFKPADRILDPRENVFYAARYLKRLRSEMGSWTKAIGRYQGGTRAQRVAYTCKIHEHLMQLEPRSAQLLDSADCGGQERPAIAPETRRKFREHQVALLALD